MALGACLGRLYCTCSSKASSIKVWNPVQVLVVTLIFVMWKLLVELWVVRCSTVYHDKSLIFHRHTNYKRTLIRGNDLFFKWRRFTLSPETYLMKKSKKASIAHHFVECLEVLLCLEMLFMYKTAFVGCCIYYAGASFETR